MGAASWQGDVHQGREVKHVPGVSFGDAETPNAIIAQAGLGSSYPTFGLGDFTCEQHPDSQSAKLTLAIKPYLPLLWVTSFTIVMSFAASKRKWRSSIQSTV
jgi:hypothetical protein